MRKNLLLSLFSLLAIIEAAPAAGISYDSPASPVSIEKPAKPAPREKVLALFMSALLEQNPEKQCFQLLDVIAMDPQNSATPFAAFSASFQKLRKTDAVLSKFNKLWQKTPVETFWAVNGSAINRHCATAPEIRIKQLEAVLKLPPASLYRRKNWNVDFTFILLDNAADAIIKSGQYEKLLPLFAKWSTAPEPHRLAAFLSLAPPCYTAAARSFCAGKQDMGKKLEKCFCQAVAGVKMAEASVKSGKEALKILSFYKKFSKLFPDNALRFVKNFYARTRSVNVNIWLLTAAAEFGDIKTFNEAAARINEYNPRFDPTQLRVKTLINGKHFSRAEKEIKRLPEKYQFDLTTRLLYKKKDWRKLTDLLQNRLAKGAPADLQTGHLLLSASEKLSDKSLYQQAKKILQPHLKIPAFANAVGYVGAVLDLDLPQGRKLLLHALEKEPRNIAYLDSMAWIAFKQKRYAEAEKWIRQALDNIDPQEGISVILEHAGDIAAVRGKDPLPFYRLSLKYAPFDEEFNKESLLKKMQGSK